MKKTAFIFLLAVLPFLSSAKVVIDTTQTGGLFDASEKPRLIAKQFSFTEGASTDKKGNVFFTDQPNNKIWEYSIDGKLTLFLDNAGRSNGTYFDTKGNLVTCADEHGQLWSISPKGKVSVLVHDLNGRQMNGPNDVWIDHDGGIYMTDPYYQRDYWQRKKSDLNGQKVYYLPKGSQTPVPVISDLEQPNGIVGSADGRFLYVADIKANKTYKYSITSDGVVANKQLIVQQGSDGMTLDERGNIYLTGKGVTIFNPAGIEIAHIDIDEPWTANLCFGGKNKNKLFITASKAIYVMQMKVKGIE